MIVKEPGNLRSSLTRFDLLGSDEIALSKAFAFTISNEPKVLFRFLQFVRLNYSNSLTNYKAIAISTEKHRKEGRTDIEVKLDKQFHLIIESKVRMNVL